MIKNLCHSMKRWALVLALAMVPAAGLAEPLTLHLDEGSAAGGERTPALGAPIGGWDFAAMVALDVPTKDYLDVGPRIAGEAMYGVQDLSPGVRLDLGMRSAFAYHSATGGSVWGWDFVPKVRIVGGVAPKLALHGDFGVGLVVYQINPDFGDSDTSVNAAFTFGGGFTYALSPTVNFLGEMSFNFYTKSDSGVFIAIPTIGLQFH